MSIRLRPLWSIALAALVTASAASHGAAPLAQRELLYSTLWMQKSAEYQLSTAQVYRMATAQLALAKRPGSASLEQQKMGGYARLPPAVVLDIDETVLDNSPYNAWMIQTGQPYTAASWSAWVALKAARPLAGAVAFTQAAARQGVRVFYVSNRDCRQAASATAPALCPEKADTAANLAALGFAYANDPRAILLRGERADWKSDKNTRRSAIARQYRIIMLLGDDLRDFMPIAVADDLRRTVNSAAASNFGQRWFLLPNPAYGSWTEGFPGAIDQRYGLLDVAPLATATGLKLATWNLEWLRGTDVSPEEEAVCATREGQADIGRCAGPLRAPADYSALKHYADLLDADVVALQEVNGPAAAARVFDPARYDFYFTDQAWIQKTGFAVKKGLTVSRHADVRELGAAEPPNLRWGADISIASAAGASLRLLAVHLKSGCFDQPLTNADPNRYGAVPCPILQAQVPVLQQWIAARTREGTPFAIMGDFNRRFSKEPAAAKNPAGQTIALWPSLTSESGLINVDQDQPYAGCSGKDRYDAFIDHIVLSKQVATVPDSYQRLRYTDQDVASRKLSDHCPMAVRVTP